MMSFHIVHNTSLLRKNHLKHQEIPMAPLNSSTYPEFTGGEEKTYIGILPTFFLFL